MLVVIVTKNDMLGGNKRSPHPLLRTGSYFELARRSASLALARNHRRHHGRRVPRSRVPAHSLPLGVKPVQEQARCRIAAACFIRLGWL